MHDSSAPDEEEDPHPEPGFSNESRGLKMGSVEVDDDDLSPAAVRQELIKRIKNGEGSAAASDSKFARLFERVRESEEASSSDRHRSPELLPPINFNGAKDKDPPILSRQASGNRSAADAGLEIERPRSALHAGDFTHSGPPLKKPPCCYHEKSSAVQDSQSISPLGSSPTTPWFIPLRRQGSPSPPKPVPPRKSLPASVPPSPSARQQPFPIHPPYQPSPAIPIAASPPLRSRSRAPSLQSFSSSFILTTPTSPLVRETRHDDLEPSSLDLSGSPSKSQRRHTFSPQAFQTFGSRTARNFSTPAQAARQPPSTLRDSPLPYQGHHPRRSLTFGTSYHASSTPQIPTFPSSRRPSISSDASPSLRATMVGSYEESILRGRMSSTPSKPLDFTAQIGALGKGDCKPKHPAHVSVEFPAVYYNWNTGIGRRGALDDEPSPYVGYIDLEHKLPPVQVKERRRRRRESPTKNNVGGLEEASPSRMNIKREKRKHHSPSPAQKIPLGGSYRIPQQGQLQILIKSPNKTAVKLFLVPYDLSGMEPGKKTFVRQRCYSTGPVIENPITSKPLAEFGPASKTSSGKDKPSLRYLIQLNICCPSKGRFYLYKSIHVVFANRVPDNKENLRNEILWPEPRYSVYKATGENTPLGASTPADGLALNARRRQSYNGPTAMSEGFMPIHGFQIPGESSYTPGASIIPPVPSLPFHFTGNKDGGSHIETEALHNHSTDLEMSDPMSPGTDSQATRETAGSLQHASSSESNSNSNGYGTVDIFSKRSRDDDRYGGVFGRPGTPEPGEGLLARRLRGVDLEAAKRTHDPNLDML